MYLAEHPLCVECEREGRAEAATDVDHIVPVTGPDDPLFWEESNHAALCHSCHSRKTARENRGFGNKANINAHSSAANVDGLPIDKRHPWSR
jgi:5-methylcytosine-specific restriction protein A